VIVGGKREFAVATVAERALRRVPTPAEGDIGALGQAPFPPLWVNNPHRSGDQQGAITPHLDGDRGDARLRIGLGGATVGNLHRSWAGRVRRGRGRFGHVTGEPSNDSWDRFAMSVAGTLPTPGDSSRPDTPPMDSALERAPAELALGRVGQPCWPGKWELVCARMRWRATGLAGGGLPGGPRQSRRETKHEWPAATWPPPGERVSMGCGTAGTKDLRRSMGRHGDRAHRHRGYKRGAPGLCGGSWGRSPRAFSLRE